MKTTLEAMIVPVGGAPYPKTSEDCDIAPEERERVIERFDTVSLVVLGSHRALVRHHINCLSVGIPRQELSSGLDLQALPEDA